MGIDLHNNDIDADLSLQTKLRNNFEQDIALIRIDFPAQIHYLNDFDDLINGFQNVKVEVSRHFISSPSGKSKLYTTK